MAKLKYECKKCKATFEEKTHSPQEYFEKCPKCGSRLIIVVAGSMIDAFTKGNGGK